MTAAPARATIIIPAHNEARIVGRLLTQVEEISADHDVVVIANGCTDGTVQVVEAHPWCRLVELSTASKIAALNAGDDAAATGVRIYLDADVSVSPETLRALARTLSSSAAIIASPSVRIDSRGGSLLSRAYQRIWALTDYRLNDHTGSGIYGMSESGRARFGRFPEIIADDLYVRLLFSGAERVVSPGSPFTIYAPRTLRAQVRRLGRTMAGELQLAERFPALAKEGGSGSARAGLLRRVARRPRLWPAFVVYATTYGAGRLSAVIKLRCGRMHVWERDLTTR